MNLLVFPDGLGGRLWRRRRSLSARLRAAAIGLALAGLVPCAAAADLSASVPAVWLELRAQAQASEHGQGVAKDGERAAALYCQAAKLGDPESQFNLGWMYAHGRGVARDDKLAAFFFRSAAEQGIAQAQRMLALVGEPLDEVPACLRDPEPIVAAAAEPVAPLPPPAPINAPKPIADLVKKLAPGFKVDPQLVLAIIKAESNFDPLAVSPKNAMGLMQLIPDTAARFNVGDPFDAKQNIRGGMAYLRWLLAYFEGDLALVAAAYNAGEGAVERYRGVPPFGETQAYVARVLKAVGALAHPFDARVTPPSPRLGKIRVAKG